MAFDVAFVAAMTEAGFSGRNGLAASSLPGGLKSEDSIAAQEVAPSRRDFWAERSRELGYEDEARLKTGLLSADASAAA